MCVMISYLCRNMVTATSYPWLSRYCAESPVKWMSGRAPSRSACETSLGRGLIPNECPQGRECMSLEEQRTRPVVGLGGCAWRRGE